MLKWKCFIPGPPKTDWDGETLLPQKSLTCLHLVSEMVATHDCD